MNAGEGKAADAFSFKSDEAFVDFLLRALTDEEDPQGLAEVLTGYAPNLAQRGTLLAEREFVASKSGTEPAPPSRPPPPWGDYPPERSGSRGRPSSQIRTFDATMQAVTSSPSDPLDFSGVRLAYDTVAEDYATHLPDTRVEAPLDLAMIDAFAEVVAASNDPQVLDAGCGAGRMSRYLAERGCMVQGVDLSSNMVALARRNHPKLLFTVGSLIDLPYPDEQFAGVMLCGTRSSTHRRPARRASSRRPLGFFARLVTCS
jgi:hypothetical protein